MFSKIALSAAMAATILVPSASFADVDNVEIEAFVRGEEVSSCEIRSGGTFFEQELAQDSLTEANLAVGNAPTGIQLEASGDVTMEVSALTEQLPGDSSIDLDESFIDVKLAGGSFGNTTLRADGGGDSESFTGLSSATTNVQMNDARIVVPDGMEGNVEYRTQTVLSCIVSD